MSSVSRKIRSSQFCFVLAASVWLFSSGCLKENEEAGEEQGATQPILVTTKNAFDSLRSRCGFNERNQGKYNISCHTVAVDSEGNEQRVEEPPPGLSLNWVPPKKIEGVELLDAFCLVRDKGLAQDCSLTLADGEAKIEFGLSVAQAETGRTKIETSVVHLPFSIETIGKIEQIPFEYLKPDVSGKSLSNGFQSVISDPNRIILSRATSMCERKGRIYVAGDGQIYSFADGAVKLFAGSSNPNNMNSLSHRLRVFLGVSGQSGVVAGLEIACSDGAVYVSDPNHTRILRIPDEGNVEVLASSDTVYATEPGTSYSGDGGPAAQARIMMPGPLAVARDGTVFFADIGNQVVRKITPQGKIFTVAGRLISGKFLGEDFPAADIPGFQPGAVALDASGALFFSDENAPRLYRWTKQEGLSLTLNLESSLDPAGWILHVFTGIAFGPEGRLYLSKAFRNEVWARQGTEAPRRVAGVGGSAGWSGDGGSALAAKFDRPRGLMARGDGSLWIADSFNNVVRQIKTDGTIHNAIGYGSKLKLADLINSAPSGTASLGEVRGLAISGDGTIYYSDATTKLVHRVLPRQLPRPYAGGGTQSFVADMEPLGLALKYPTGLALSNSGELYVSDESAHSVYKIAEGKVTRVAGTGLAGFAGDGGPAGSARLFNPRALALDPSGRLFISDAGNNRIRVISNGRIQTIVGGGAVGFGDGLAGVSILLSGGASSLLWGKDGLLYFIPVNQSVVARLVPDGEAFRIELVAGEINSRDDSGDGGPAKLAKFGVGAALTGLPDGRILVSDTSSARVRVLTPFASDPSQFRVDAFFGGKTSRDCGSGVLSGNVKADQMEGAVNASLATICTTLTSVLASSDSCATPGGTIHVAIQQGFSRGQYLSGRAESELGQIIRISRACPK